MSNDGSHPATPSSVPSTTHRIPATTARPHFVRNGNTEGRSSNYTPTSSSPLGSLPHPNFATLTARLHGSLGPVDHNGHAPGEVGVPKSGKSTPARPAQGNPTHELSSPSEATTMLVSPSSSLPYGSDPRGTSQESSAWRRDGIAGHCSYQEGTTKMFFPQAARPSMLTNAATSASYNGGNSSGTATQASLNPPRTPVSYSFVNANQGTAYRPEGGFWQPNPAPQPAVGPHPYPYYSPVAPNADTSSPYSGTLSTLSPLTSRSGDASGHSRGGPIGEPSTLSPLSNDSGHSATHTAQLQNFEAPPQLQPLAHGPAYDYGPAQTAVSKQSHPLLHPNTNPYLQTHPTTHSAPAPRTKGAAPRSHVDMKQDQDDPKARRHVCPVCDKRFNRPSSLNTHMSVHTGAKPYQCLREGCGRRFSVSSNLRRHERTHDQRGREVAKSNSRSSKERIGDRERDRPRREGRVTAGRRNTNQPSAGSEAIPIPVPMSAPATWGRTEGLMPSLYPWGYGGYTPHTNYGSGQLPMSAPASQQNYIEYNSGPSLRQYAIVGENDYPHHQHLYSQQHALEVGANYHQGTNPMPYSPRINQNMGQYNPDEVDLYVKRDATTPGSSTRTSPTHTSAHTPVGEGYRHGL